MDTVSTIYFAGGCFWGTEHFMKQVCGVTGTRVGYANGNDGIMNPTYQQVRVGDTGFAETVEVCYDPQTVDLRLLIDLFFKTIDPTSLNRQGEDVGTQYRTGIYYTVEADRSLIEKMISELSAGYDCSIVVEVEPLRNFYPAEDYHQDYLDKNPDGYCHIHPELFALARQANAKAAADASVGE